MPTGELKSYIYLASGELAEIKEYDLSLSEELESVESVDFNTEFSGSFEIQFPLKYNNKTLKWFRKYLLIDLLTINFPKKKNRRKKRLEKRLWKKLSK